MRIIKSINTANLSTVSIQGDLLTTTAIACFNRLKAKCSYCICQTRQERSMLFLCQESGNVHGGSQHISHTTKSESPKPCMKFSCECSDVLLRGEQSHLYTARSKYVNNASNYINDFCQSWDSWAGNSCIFFSPNILLEVKMQNCSMCLCLNLPEGAVSCWGIFQLLNSEGMTKHFAVLMKAKVSDKHMATRLVRNISRNCTCLSHFTVLASLFLWSAQEVSVLKAKSATWLCSNDWRERFCSFRKFLSPNINRIPQLPEKHMNKPLIGLGSCVRKTWYKLYLGIIPVYMPAGTEIAFQKLFPDNTSVQSPDLKIANSLFKAQSKNLSICKRDLRKFSFKWWWDPPKACCICGFYSRSMTLNLLYLVAGMGQVPVFCVCMLCQWASQRPQERDFQEQYCQR